MSIKSTVITSFISANATAYAAASKVFLAIESNTFAETLAASGVIGSDVKVFATVWVSEESKGTKLAPKPQVFPHEYRGTWVFAKDSAEHSRVKYLVAVISGAAARKAGARKSAKVDPVEVLIKGYKALTAAQKKAFMAAI
jgi:hypothetical protein